jgi:hypothetical protein
MMRMRSSAYSVARWGMERTPKSWSRCQWSALQMSMLSTSMIKRNNIRESGSPYRRPRAWQICWPGHPFIMALMLDEARMADTQFLHAGGNPTCSMTSMRKSQATKSNALEISTLNSKQACRLVERSLVDACTKRKLSWIMQPLINAL